MFIQRAIRFSYQLVKRFPGLVRIVQTALPQSIETRITDTVLRVGGVSGERKLIFRDGRYENNVAGKGFKPGCNLVGFVYGEFGIGEHLRYTARSFQAEGIPFSLYNYDRTLHPQADFSLKEYVADGNSHSTNIFCMNNEGIMHLHASNSEIFKDRYNIGYGFWELSDYPDEWLYAMNFLDEIWAPSRYIQEVISKKASVPVLHMPMAVDFSLSRKSLRKDLDITEDDFVFLFSLDFSSRIHRKNPKAVIDAFKKAFPGHKKHVMLVIKTKLVMSVRQQVRDFEMLQEWVREDPRIRFLNETYDRDRMLDLIHSCDVYVSLHRSEGFGLGLAEAMKLGKAVIATDYSGNRDFTNRENACLVDYTLRKVEKEDYYLPGSSVWADANVEQAAGYMRRLLEDEAYRKRIGEKAQTFINENHSFQVVGKRYRSRLKLIGLLSNEEMDGGLKLASFSVNLLSQMTATAYNAGVSILLMFLLGRVMGPKTFGQYSYILTLASLFFVFQNGGIRTLIFREKTLATSALKEYGGRLFSWGLGHTLFTTLAGIFCVLILPFQYRLGIIAALLVFGSQSVATFVSSVLRGEGRFPREAKWQVMVRTYGAAGILVALLFQRPEPWIVFVGWFVGLLLCFCFSPVPLKKPSFGGFKILDIRRACLGLMAIDAATVVYYRCDIILLQYLTGNSVQVGYYSAAYRFLEGVVLMAVPLRIVLFRDLRLAWEDKSYFESQIVKMGIWMLGVACLVLGIGALFSKEIVYVTFGSAYSESAVLLPWLLAALLFVLPSGILTQGCRGEESRTVLCRCGGDFGTFKYWVESGFDPSVWREGGGMGDDCDGGFLDGCALGWRSAEDG